MKIKIFKIQFELKKSKVNVKRILKLKVKNKKRDEK